MQQDRNLLRLGAAKSFNTWHPGPILVTGPSSTATASDATASESAAASPEVSTARLQSWIVEEVALGLMVCVTTLSPTLRPLVISVSVLLAIPIWTFFCAGVVPPFRTST